MSEQDVMMSAGSSDVAADRIRSGSDRRLEDDGAVATPAGGTRERDLGGLV